MAGSRGLEAEAEVSMIALLKLLSMEQRPAAMGHLELNMSVGTEGAPPLGGRRVVLLRNQLVLHLAVTFKLVRAGK